MYRTFTAGAVFALFTILNGCQTIGQLDCTHKQIAKYNQHQDKWRCAEDETTAAAGSAQGILWINHHDFAVSPTESVTMTTNGTTVIVKPKSGGTFPKRELVAIFTPTIPPGHHITGVRVCYGLLGDQATTEIRRLRLTQFQSGGSTTGGWPGYLVRLEDTSVASQAPNPPAGGFVNSDTTDNFVCVSSASSANLCLDPANGTISPSLDFQFGDADEIIHVMAVGLHYDKTCTPN